MRRSTTALLTVLSLGLALALGACGSDSGDADGAGAGASEGGAASTATDAGSFCTGLKDAGYTGADFGPVAFYEPTENVRARVEALRAPADLAAPEELADAWEQRQGFLQRLQDAVDAAGDADTLMAAGDVADLSPTDDEQAAGTTLQDWWFADCQ